jgi:hypothetical protein
MKMSDVEHMLMDEIGKTKGLRAELKAADGEISRLQLELIRSRERSTKELATANKEIERLKDVLHCDKTGMALALADVRRIANSWSWAMIGRGNYTWDDDAYQEEMGHLITAVMERCTEALGASGELAHAECCHRGIVNTLRAELEARDKVLDEASKGVSDPMLCQMWGCGDRR